MKINEVEAAVGVTKKNIRFYEEEGLITPGREPGNGYRSYSQTDVERLRRIKLLRKLDVPLAEIREMLEGQSTLAEGMNRQLERLSTRRKDLEEAIGFCTLLRQEPGVDVLAEAQVERVQHLLAERRQLVQAAEQVVPVRVHRAEPARSRGWRWGQRVPDAAQRGAVLGLLPAEQGHTGHPKSRRAASG